MTKLITKSIRDKLIENQRHIDNNVKATILPPVVKLFTPDAAATWIIVSATEVEDDLLLWGWCDLGLGFPEYGQVSLNALKAIRGSLGLPVERDMYFNATDSIDDYVTSQSMV